tara:strand:- start:238 stop:393 length:156 start_codon:yes stop_codon:yes gene_type:complete
MRKIKKDIPFYVECLKMELRKDWDKQDVGYTRYLDDKISKLIQEQMDNLNK